MRLSLRNTLTGQVEPVPNARDGEISMYHCGPTVYSRAHVGNLRAYVFADLVRRAAEAEGLKVRQAINITDVGHLVSDADSGDDKVEKAARERGEKAADIARRFEELFLADIGRLNVKTDGTAFPRATDFIAEQIELVRALEGKGLTYTLPDGVYFDTAKFPAYGALGGIDLEGQKAGARVATVDGKRSPTDFALWKLTPAGVSREQEWDSPWGKGFPGWHAECSAMIQKVLGLPIDLHTGGIDHIPVHHNNEIAQTEGATGTKLALHWSHVAFINVDGQKVSKSIGNTYDLDQIAEWGVSPLAYRYWLMSSHYRTPANLTKEALLGAATAYARLGEFVAAGPRALPDSGVLVAASAALWDDLDTPKVLAIINETAKREDLAPEVRRATLVALDPLTGLNFGGYVSSAVDAASLPDEIKSLFFARAAAREAKNFAESDRLRDELKGRGYEVSDGAGGQSLRKI
jgi:cysteinyl-tRNA synthetase